MLLATAHLSGFILVNPSRDLGSVTPRLVNPRAEPAEDDNCPAVTIPSRSRAEESPGSHHPQQLDSSHRAARMLFHLLKTTYFSSEDWNSGASHRIPSPVCGGHGLGHLALNRELSDGKALSKAQAVPCSWPGHWTDHSPTMPLGCMDLLPQDERALTYPRDQQDWQELMVRFPTHGVTTQPPTVQLCPLIPSTA